MKRNTMRIALPKCAELDQIREQFRACGFDIPVLRNPGLHRMGDPLDTGYEFEFFRVEAADVGTYVEHGICHAGVMGTDLIRETEAAIWRPYTFQFGRYPIVFAAPKGESFKSLAARPQIRVATPFPKFARQVFANRSIVAEILPVSDSATACLLGLADGFIDRLIDPAPLLKHDLRVVEALGFTHFKLIVNRASSAMRKSAIQKLIGALKEHQPTMPPDIDIPFDDDEEEMLLRIKRNSNA